MDKMGFDAMVADLDHREKYPEMYDENGNFKRREDYPEMYKELDKEQIKRLDNKLDITDPPQGGSGVFKK